jgi:hypothetical protein
MPASLRELIAKQFARLAADKLDQELSGLTDPIVGFLVHLSPGVRQQAERNQDFGPTSLRG